jgi:cytohesin
MKGGAIAVVAWGLLVGTSEAHETDQYTVPLGKQFAELGPYCNAIAYDAVSGAVTKLNKRIQRQLDAGQRVSTRLYTPDELGSTVFFQFTSAYFIIENLERDVASKEMRLEHAGLLPGYEEHFKNIYDDVHFVLDPRQFFRIWHAKTLNIYGSYAGTDKIGHFTDMGYQYFRAYRRAINAGHPKEMAERKAVRVGTNGLFFAEEGMIGYLSAGAYSNADLASNYAGFKFYQNLTEVTRIKGEYHQPLVTIENGFWQMAPHVRLDSDFFEIFVSDHFNEALNPSLFEKAMRKEVRSAVGDRCDRVLVWYADDNGNRRPQEYFAARQRDLQTYYGEDYGYRGTVDDLMTIANVCFEEPDQDSPGGRNARGETVLHIAARNGDLDLIQNIIDGGMNVDITVESQEHCSTEWGNTPLHEAAAAGQPAAARALLQRGADVNAVNDSGATPLHKAIGSPEVAAVLLDGGADTNACDIRGRTPLNWSARYPQEPTIELLVAHGADLNSQDHHGETPMHRAAWHGHAATIEQLASFGARVDVPANLGGTPLHYAARNDQRSAILILLDNSAAVNAIDEFGWTPLHDAASRGNTHAAKLLLDSDARVNAPDAYGTMPLHVAARYGQEQTARYLTSAGADLHAWSGSNSTPAEEASQAGNESLAQFLQEARSNDPTAGLSNGVTTGEGDPTQ